MSQAFCQNNNDMLFCYFSVLKCLCVLRREKQLFETVWVEAFVFDGTLVGENYLNLNFR